MKKLRMRLVVAASLSILLFVAHRELTSQTGNTFLGGLQRTIQFENDDVAVWKAVVPPNAPLTMHTHQHARVIIPIIGGVMKVVNEDGTSDTHTWDTGKAYWLPLAEGLKRHADQNIGTMPIEVMVIELKKDH